MKKIALLAALACVALTGCSNMPAIAKALSKDPAFVTVQVRTIYGTAFMVRDGRPQSGNTVTPEGHVSSIPAELAETATETK